MKNKFLNFNYYFFIAAQMQKFTILAKIDITNNGDIINAYDGKISSEKKKKF